MVRSAPDASTSPSRLACASKWSCGLGDRQPGVAREQLDDLLREAGRGVDAGADGGAAERAPRRRGGAPPATRSMPRRIWRRVAAELLAERDRRRVHEVGAAGLDHARPRLGLRLEGDREVVEGGDQVVDERLR